MTGGFVGTMLLATAIGIAAVAGCTSSGAAQEDIVAETSALRVTAHGLLRDVLAAPVAGALVEIRCAGGGAALAREKTASDGSFTLKVQRAGTYDILVTPRDRFAPQSFPAQAISGSGTLELVLYAIPAPTLGQRSGRIVDPGGNPVSAQVCGDHGCDLTGADGVFQVTIDVDGPRRISVEGGVDGSFEVGIDLPPDGPDGTLGDIVVPLYKLTGQVVDAAGAPVAGTTVIAPSCYTVSGDGFDGHDCLDGLQTDANGRFHFVILPGRVLFLVRGPVGAFLPIDVTGDTDVTIALPPTQRLSGQVVDRDGHGQAGTSICLTHAGCFSKYCGPVCTNSDVDGHYQVDVSAGDYAMELAPAIERPLGLYRLTKPVSLSAAQGSQVDIVFPNQQLTGQVLDDSGVPDPGVVVIGMCYDATFDGWTGSVCPTTVTTDTDGRFQLAVVAPGTATLQVQGAVPKSVAVTFGVDTDVQIQLPGPTSGVATGGQIVDDDGRGLPGAQVCYSLNFFATCATTDADGRYQLMLVPDTYEISASVLIGVDDVSVSYPAVAVPSAPLTLQVVAPRRLPGQLLALDGQPISGATIFRVCPLLSRSDLSEIFCAADSELTDSAGRFALPWLPGAPAQLVIQLAGADPGDIIDIMDATAGGSATSVTVAVQPASAAPAPPPCAHATKPALVTSL